MAVANRQRLYDKFVAAKARGVPEHTALLTLAVAEATHDGIQQVRDQNDELKATLARSNEVLENCAAQVAEIHSATVKGETPVDISERS